MILGSDGLPYRAEPTEAQVAKSEVARLQRQVNSLRAKYDAAQNSHHSENHWLNADYLDPNSSNSYMVRKKLRSRSRYEVIENNPYLKGTILTVANDFVGKGPKLNITDSRLTTEQKQTEEKKWHTFAKLIKLTRKLWQNRIAKCVDGESFLVMHNDDNPVGFNIYVAEADRFTSEYVIANGRNQKANSKQYELDGIRFDEWERPTAYHLVSVIPGLIANYTGSWIDAKYVCHWYRKDRNWLRGIPELTTSLPLCALLRRYTLAVVRAAELGANFSAVLETETPADPRAWTDGEGNLIEDDPFDMFPVEMGMITKLPWGSKLSQFDSKQPTVMYDKFVNSLLREILRPIGVPFNIGVGSSEDSTMSSAVVDAHLYITTQEVERQHCEEEVLEKVYSQYNTMANLSGYSDTPADIEHEWNWDKVGIEHTDPQKVANALVTMQKQGYITDKDIQEKRFNRSVEDWQREVERDKKFRIQVGLPFGEPEKLTNNL